MQGSWVQEVWKLLICIARCKAPCTKYPAPAWQLTQWPAGWLNWDLGMKLGPYPLSCIQVQLQNASFLEEPMWPKRILLPLHCTGNEPAHQQAIH